MENDMEETEEEIDAEPARETDKDALNWAIACHLSAFCMFIGIPFGNILGPLVVWLIKRNEYDFVNDQGKAALNFQTSMTLYGVIIFAIGFGLLFSQSGAFNSAFS